MPQPSHPFDRNRVRFRKRDKEFPDQKGELHDIEYFGHVGHLKQWPDSTAWNFSLRGEGRYRSQDNIATFDEAKSAALQALEEIFG